MKPDRLVLAFCLSLALAACDGREEAALTNVADGNNSNVTHSVKAEAEAVMAPLEPPAPGTPGGLPISPPVEEGKIDPDSAQGAAQVVQGYYGLLEQQRFADALDLWAVDSEYGREDDDGFAKRFRAFSEIHANIGAPTEAEGAAGSTYVTVPVQAYGRLAANGHAWYRLRQVTLRRVNDVDGASATERRWHIERIGAYVPPAAPTDVAANAISATDGMAGAK